MPPSATVAPPPLLKHLRQVARLEKNIMLRVQRQEGMRKHRPSRARSSYNTRTSEKIKIKGKNVISFKPVKRPGFDVCGGKDCPGQIITH